MPRVIIRPGDNRYKIRSDGAAPVDATAWNLFLSDIQDQGAVGELDGTYDLSQVQQFLITGRIELQGKNGKEPMLKGGAKGIDLFGLRHGALIFSNMRTTNITLIAGTDKDTFMTGRVNRLEIANWTYENTTQRAVAMLRQRKNGDQEVPIGQKILHRLTLRNIRGTGGLGGLCVQVPIRKAVVADINITGIDVPNDRAYFHPQKGRIRKMLNSGYGDGLNLGENTREAAELCEGGSVRRVTIAEIMDNREPTRGMKKGAIATTDGIRILLPRMLMTRLHVSDVNSAIENETSGAYFKSHDSEVTGLKVVASGGHEAAVVIKGADDESAPSGDDLRIRKLQIIGDNKRRSALYLGADGVVIDDLLIRRTGGKLKGHKQGWPPRYGYGPLIFCEGTNPMARLTLGTVRVQDCTSHSSAETGALFIMGYKDISIGTLVFNGLKQIVDPWKKKRDDNDNLVDDETARKKFDNVCIRVVNKYDIASINIEQLLVRKPADEKTVALKIAGNGQKGDRGKIGVIRIGELDIQPKVKRAVLMAGQERPDELHIEDIDAEPLKRYVRAAGNRWPRVTMINGKPYPPQPARPPRPSAAATVARLRRS